MTLQIIEVLSKYGLDITHVEIEEKYSEPHRYYHIFSHPTFMIKKINELFDNGTINEEEKDILILAALFHDIVYNPQFLDNEFQSVLFLQNRIRNYRQDDESERIMKRVIDIIFSTEKHIKTGDKLTDILLDLDMFNIANGSFIQLLSDERNVFKEYQFVNYDLYKTERIKFLKSTLEQEYGKKNETNIKLLIDWVNTQKINVGVYAGSFNPFHKGHLDILHKGQNIFDKVILAIGVNPEKSTSEDYIKTLKSNIQYLIQKLNVEVCFYDGLLTDFIQEKQTKDNIDITLIRGLRDGFDLAYENRQIQFMKDIYPELKTVYIQSDRNLDHISSSAIKILEKYNPKLIEKYLP